MRKPNTVDFETMPIENRPDYPPEPVGVAIYEVGRRPRYMAWGHPEGNNCTKAEARRELKRVWAQRRKRPLLFHNGKFDIDVGRVHLGLAMPAPDEWEDTEFLMFLNDPYAAQLSLKPLADKYLDMPPDEQAELHEWILSHVFTSQKRAEGSVALAPSRPEGFHKVPPSKAGKFIAYAPGGLVGRYAVGDVVRTRKLFDRFAPEIRARGMWEAYEREKRAMPELLESETNGVRVAHSRLRKDLQEWEESLEGADAWLRRRLGAKELDVDSNAELADALEDAGVVTEWILTEKGNRSTSKENLLEVVEDQDVLDALTYRAKLANTIRNFGRPWLAMADRTGGYIHTQWHQVRKSDERGRVSNGARTGRLSSTPNFQNANKQPKVAKLPRSLRGKVVALPYIRDYIVPWDRGHWLYGRDYSQQELRVLGHFEDQVLLRAYQQDPKLDVHELARAKINALLGTSLGRKPIKNMGFGIIYGMGIGLLAKMMGVDVRTAKVIKQAYLDIFPGLRELNNALQDAGRAGEAIRTWGGREYFTEPPRRIKGELRSFEYKLLNYLIQGSSADCSKQALINYGQVRHEDSRVLLLVHDEFLCSVPKTLVGQEMAKLREAMLDVDFDVEMLSDGKVGAVSWARMKKVKY